MIRKLGPGMLCAALLLAAATACAESASGGPAHDRDLRTRSRSDGVSGLAMLRLAGGVSLPTSDFGGGFETGAGLGLSLAYGVSPIILLSAGIGVYHFGADDELGEVDVIPMTLQVDAMIPTGGSVHPWVGVGFGLYNVDSDAAAYDASEDYVLVNESETNPGVNFGAGLGGPMGARTTWGVALRYHHVSEGETLRDVNFATLQLGVGVAL